MGIFCLVALVAPLAASAADPSTPASADGLENVLDGRNVHPMFADSLDSTVHQDGGALRAEVSAWF